MRKLPVTFFVITLSLLIAACGQKTDSTSETAQLVYANFADASAAAETSGKHMVLDFYTDW